MAKIAVSPKSNRSRLFKIFAGLILLTATGAVLYGIPPFLLDISRITQSAVGKMPHESAGENAAPAILRGSVYDQGFNELAVSYRLYTLNVRPADMTDHRATVQALAQVTGRPAADLEGSLKSSRQSLRLMDDLDERQAAAIEGLHLPGVFCVPVEYRFYPAHTAASHVLGFMDGRTGLAGVEGRYDAVLSSRTVRNSNIPAIDFKGQQILGAESVDLILTLDLRLQRQLEQMVREYLAAQGLGKGMGLLLEPGSGRVLALVNQPAFNPNYFWKARDDNRVNRIYSQLLDRDLIRPIMARAAAIERGGLDGAPLLPATVAAPDYGFSGDMLHDFARRIRLFDSVSDNWEGGASQDNREGSQEAVTGVQIGATLASLVNGGWRINPFVVDSIYDHGSRTRFYRKNEGDSRAHVLDPALSVKVRRDLFSCWVSTADNKILYRAEKRQDGSAGELRGYSIQRLFAGMVPAQYPRYLLVIAVETSEMQPRQGSAVTQTDSLVQLGRSMLSYVQNHPPQVAPTEEPPPRNEENKNQFFISRRLAAPKTPEEVAARTATMPALRGLSLRKALRKMDPYKMKVNITGRGRVVAQYPLAGSPLHGANECALTLDER